MRRRLDIAASIVVTPELMFLDEPTTGLDPRSRNQVWDIIRALVAEGHDDPALHPVPGGGRPARRRDRRDRPRQGDRRGHARPAQGLGRLRRAARAPARSRAAAARPSGCSSRELGAVTLEADPAALSVACADADRAAEAVAELVALGRADRRLLARPAQPRRGLPGPDRPPGRGGPGRRNPTPTAGGAGGMSANPTTQAALAPAADEAAVRKAISSTARPPRAERAVGRAHLRLARDAQGQARARAAARRDDHAGDVRR